MRMRLVLFIRLVFSPFLSRARSFLFCFGNVITLMLKYFFVPPMALRNETFMKTQ